MWEGIHCSKSKTFLAFCFCFLIGVVFASIALKKIPVILFFLLFSAVFSGLYIFWKSAKQRFLFFALFFFSVGILRYHVAFPFSSENHVISYIGQKKTLHGIVAAEPDVRTDSVRYILDIQDTVTGKVYAKYGLYPRFVYGDAVEIFCRLEKPEPIEKFRYDLYLARSGVFAVCQSPSIKKVGAGEGNMVLSGVLYMKNKVAEKIHLLWPEPYASFMAGLLYGYRGGLGSLDELFARTGVTHIVAISGYNITLIATIFSTLCVHLSIPRKKASLIVTTGIILFVVFTGASASVVRAGVMALLVLLANASGRLSRMGNILAGTAVLMVLHNPLVLVWDAGFQLSFFSTLGLIYLSPLLRKRTGWLPEFMGLKETGLTTLSAIIATLPAILYHFGRVSLVAPVVNILILWTIPWIMLGGFVSVLMGFIVPVIGEWVALVPWVGMRYIVFVVEWFGALSFATIDVI